MSEEEELKKLAKKLDMLERLTDNGGIKAQKELEKEIIKRIEEGNDTVIKYLIKESHVFYITDSDFRNTDKDTIKKLKNEVSFLKLANPARDRSEFHKYLLMEKFKEKEDDRDFIKKLLKYNLTNLFNIEIIQEIISETNFIQNLINMIKADWMYTEWFGHVISDLKSVALNQTKEKIFDILTKGTPAEQKIILTIECGDYFESKDSFFKNRKKFIEIFSEEFLSSILTESNSKFIENLMQQSEVTIDSFEGVLEYILEKIKNVNFVSFKNKLIEIFKTKKFIWIENFRLFLEILHESGLYRFTEEDMSIILKTVLENYHKISSYWEKQNHFYGEENLFMIFSGFVKNIPSIFSKVITEVIEKDDKIIKILIENLFWGLSLKEEADYQFIYEYRNVDRPSYFKNISIMLKSKILKYLLGGLDDSKYFIPLYVGEVEDLIEEFYELWDNPYDLFMAEILNAFREASYPLLRRILLYLKYHTDESRSILKLDCSNPLIYKSILLVSKGSYKEVDWDKKEANHHFQDDLYQLGKDHLDQFKEEIKITLEGDDKDNFSALIKLRWIELYHEKEIIQLLENPKIDFINKFIELFKMILKEEEDKDDKLAYCLGLFNKIYSLDDKNFYDQLINGIKKLIPDILKILNRMINEDSFFDYLKLDKGEKHCFVLIDILGSTLKDLK